jgi:hypothetical protein
MVCLTMPCACLRKKKLLNQFLVTRDGGCLT